MEYSPGHHSRDYQICGSPLTDATDLYTLSPDKIITKIVTAGVYGGGYTCDNTHGLMYELLNMPNRLLWTHPTAYFVRMDLVTTVADSGATQPAIMPKKLSSSSWSYLINSPASISTATSNTGVTIDNTAYQIKYGDIIDFEITKGTNGDATGLQLILTFILE